MAGTRDSLTARSVLLSVLLGTDPPRLPVRVLVRTTALFGLAEGTTRTALSRMVAAGEVESTDGVYRLAGPHLLARQDRQQRSRRGPTVAWDGVWAHLVVAASTARSANERSTLRGTLERARFAELREGVWLRPDNLGHEASVEPGDDLVRFGSTVDGDPAVLARRLWDLDGWSTNARDLIDAMGSLLDPLEAGQTAPLADGFVLSAAVLRSLQADPLLPAELIADSWPGAELRSVYDRYDAAYRAVLRQWFRDQPA